MKYKSSLQVQKQKRVRRLKWFGLFGLLLFLGGGAFILSGSDKPNINISISSIIPKQIASSNADLQPSVSCTRILRSQIPNMPMMSINAIKVFNDNNDTQLEAARKNGIANPYRQYNPEHDSSLVRIYSNYLYCVDEMDYSSPYLVHDAALLLQMLATRFHQIVNQCKEAEGHTYRLIVTSALRTPSSVTRLRRYNRNASDKSCHIYGTTVDVSYIRFLRDDNVVVNEVFLQQALAKAFYELRYEGLCYVKYERHQSCYHFTLRSVNYSGPKASEKVEYAQLKKAPCPSDLTYDELMLPKTSDDVLPNHIEYIVNCISVSPQIESDSDAGSHENNYNAPYVSDIFIYANKI